VHLYNKQRDIIIVSELEQNFSIDRYREGKAERERERETHAARERERQKTIISRSVNRTRRRRNRIIKNKKIPI